MNATNGYSFVFVEQECWKIGVRLWATVGIVSLWIAGRKVFR